MEKSGKRKKKMGSTSYLVHLAVGAISYQLNQVKDARRILQMQRKHSGRITILKIQ